MVAQVSYWSMTYDDITYKWTAGRDYDVSVSDGVITMTSDWGSGSVPVQACNPDLLREVFGLEIAEVA